MKPTCIIFLLYFFVYCSFCEPTDEGMCNITFDPNNFIVNFSPWVRDDDKPNEYEEEDLIPMIQMFSTRFLTIACTSITISDKKANHSEIYIPTAVAKFNKNHVSSKGQRSLQVILNWEVIENEISSDDRYSSFIFTKELADRANLIFPWTVKTILLRAFELTENNAEQMTDQIVFAKSLISNETLPYELGSMFSIYSCENIERWLQEFMNNTIGQLDYIFVQINAAGSYQGNGVDIACQKIVKRFNKCKNKLQRRKLSLKVGLRTSWQDIDSDGKENISNLIRFWENMNNFARDTDTQVIMIEAFDQPFLHKYGYVFAHTGWWKLNNSMTYWNSKEYIFDEKCAQAHLETNSPDVNSIETQVPKDDNAKPLLTLEDKVTINPDKTIKHLDKVNPTKSPETGVGRFEIGVTLSVLVVGFMLLTIGYVYWKMRKYKNTIQVCKAEIKEFFEGRHDFSTDNPVDGSVYEPDITAYDRTCEIDSSSFKLDESVPLGSGEFGNVYLGKVQTADMEITTAVKVAKKNSAVALKSLMCEIKVLSYIGLHDNIVRFVGAHTAQLKKEGTLLLFLELCPNGSLLKYLRRHDERIPREIVTYLDLTGEKNIDDTSAVDLQIMLQWCQDISKGMEYLVSKRLVHSDLASRNVLLDQEKRAKICDFGLSRRLYDYSSYFKSNTEPLPWRWMSPESLRRMEFNEKSDVWAFGVTVWEIFSFGDVPYPGLSWTNDFAMRLEAGLCLQRPSNCPQDLYDKMLRCWNVSPLSRPTFAQLTTEFAENVGD